MNNEFIFSMHSLLVIGCSFGALRFGASALTTWICLQAISANLFVTKQIHLFGLDVTASDVFGVGCILGLNLLQERFSKEKALKASKLCLFFMTFFAAASYIHLLYTPNIYDTTHAAFSLILSPAPRLLAASIGVFFIVQYFDTFFFAWLKNRLPKTPFAMRGTISLILSQCIDTLLFTYFGLSGIVESLIDTFVMSLCIKLLVVLFLMPASLWITKKI